MLDNSTYRNDYLANGSQFLFYYTFKIFASSELMVYVDEVLKIEGVNYHLTGAGEDEGGTVSFGYLNESSEWVDAAPAADSEIAFIRQVAYTQTASLPSHSPFASETIEQALDRIVIVLIRPLERELEKGDQPLELAGAFRVTDAIGGDCGQEAGLTGETEHLGEILVEERFPAG